MKVFINVACPLLSGTEPSVTVPFMKVTVPVGVPLYCGATVAVRVTDCPTMEGFKLEASVVVVVAWFTACISVDDVLAVKLTSPEYTELSDFVPGDVKTLSRIAWPPLSGMVSIKVFVL
jgi:hypothetical protein